MALRRLLLGRHAGTSRRRTLGGIVATCLVGAAISTVSAQTPAVPPTPEGLIPLPPVAAEEVSSAETAMGEDAVPLSLADVENIALAQNPSLIRAQAMVQAAEGNWVQVGLPFNPLIGYLGQQLGSGGQAEQHGLLLQQEFMRGRKRQLNRAVAEQEIVAAQQQLATQEQRVLTDVRLAFYDTLLAQKRLQLAEELSQVAQRGLETVDQLRKAGESSRIDQLQAGLELQAAEVLTATSLNKLAASRRSLAAVVGVRELPTVQLVGDLEAVSTDQSWSDSLDRLQSLSPEIATYAANLERARWSLQRALVEPTPNVTVQGVVMSDNGINGKTDGILQVTLPLPLYNRNQGAIQQAQSEVIAAEHAMAQLELRLQNQLAPVYERYVSAANQVQRYRESILPAAKESLDLVRQGYQAGEYPFLNLLNAQRTYFQTNLQYLDAIRELRSSSIEMEGMLLRDSNVPSP